MKTNNKVAVFDMGSLRHSFNSTATAVFTTTISGQVIGVYQLKPGTSNREAQYQAMKSILIKGGFNLAVDGIDNVERLPIALYNPYTYMLEDKNGIYGAESAIDVSPNGDVFTYSTKERSISSGNKFFAAVVGTPRVRDIKQQIAAHSI